MKGLLEITNNPLSQQLGWILLHSLWEGAVGAAIYAILRVGMRRSSANARYMAGCTMLSVLITAPVITVLYLGGTNPGPSPKRSTELLAQEPVAGNLARALSTTEMTTPALWIRTGNLADKVLPWMVRVWALGVLALAGRWYGGSRWVHWVRKEQTTLPGLEWILTMRDLSNRLGIRRPVMLLKSGLVEVPMVVGWLRPVILLPASVLSNLPPGQLEAILAHELAHVRRHDYLVNMMQNISETLMFYHPVIWWVSKCIREERENCCDDLVIRVCGDRLNYARALMSLEEGRDRPQLAFAAAGGSLLGRIRRLLGNACESRPPSISEFGGITLASIGFVFILVALWQYHQPADYEAATLVKVTPASMPEGSKDAGNSMPYPYLLKTECLVLNSSMVLRLAADSLNIATNQTSIANLMNAGPLEFLRSRLDLAPVPNTSVIEIRARDPEPAQAARIANAIAAAYQRYRLDQRRASIEAKIDSLETRFREQSEKTRQAADEVDQFRAKLDSFERLSEPVPTAVLSSETLRHIESLQVESLTDYAKQKALLERLEKLDPREVQEVISAVGIADHQLATSLDSLAIVDQKLVSVQHEWGPENPEVIKLKAQKALLAKLAATRTEGILKGLRAKTESTGEGLVALSNELVHARSAELERSARNSRYWEARRNLDELQKFSSTLLTKIASERIDLQTGGTAVEIVEEAIAPPLGAARNRQRTMILFFSGCLLVLLGLYTARTGGPAVGIPQPA